MISIANILKPASAVLLSFIHQSANCHLSPVVWFTAQQELYKDAILKTPTA